MAVIYSYPQATPTSADLLIGTLTSDASGENPTKTFSIQDIINLVPAAGTGGTVTSVGLTTNTNASGTSNPFFNITGSPINGAGDINIDLNTTGTPSSSTFLNGNGEWAAPVGTGTQTVYALGSSANAGNVDVILSATGTSVTTSTIKLLPSGPITLSNVISSGTLSELTIGSTAVAGVTAATAAGTTSVASFIEIGGTTQNPTVALTASGLGSPAANYSLRGDGTWGLLTSGGTMSSWNLNANTGTPQQIDNAETAKIVGGTGIDTAVADNGGVAEVTIALAANTPNSIAGVNPSTYDNSGESISISNTGNAYSIQPKNQVVSGPTPTVSGTPPDVIKRIVSLTQAQYTALTPKDVNTLYVVV